MRRPVPSSAVPLALIAAVLVASGCSSESKPPTPLHVSTFELQSKLLGKQLDQVLVTPQGGGHGRPLLVFLHGYGGDPAGTLDDRFLAAPRPLRGPAPPVLPPGGQGGRGADPGEGRWGAPVPHEGVPPALPRSGAHP